MSNRILYVGLDVHMACIVIAVLNAAGKLISEAVIETKTQAVRDFISSLRGEVHLTFEEGTHAAWLFDLISPLVAAVVVCNPRHNRLLHSGNKSDRVDARKLAELLRNGSLKAVYHGEHGTRTLKELVRCYECVVEDTTRVKNRLKAIYRSRAILCAGREPYRPRHRQQWLTKLSERGARKRAEILYQQLDSLKVLHREAKREMLTEGRKHPAHKLLRQIPELGPIRVAQIMATIDTPWRFRTKRQLWDYIGLAVETHSTADYEVADGRVSKRPKVVRTRGLNRDYNRRLKSVFKSAATAACRTEVYRPCYEQLLAGGMRAEMARLVVARKIAATTLAVWKSGESFDARRVMRQAA